MILNLRAIRAQYLPEHLFLRYQWKSDRPGLAGFREGMSTIAQLVGQGTVELVLLDMNGLPSLGLEEQAWLALHWLPRVMSAAVRQVALVLPERNMYNQMVAESLLRGTRTFLRFDIQFFADTAGGLDWLVGHQPIALAALDTEWQEASHLSQALAS